jgi:hypothetical protein
MTHSEHPIDTPQRAPSPVHGFGTLAVHAGSPHDPVTGAVIEAVCHLGHNDQINKLIRSRSHFQQPLRKPASANPSAHTTTPELQTPTGRLTRQLLKDPNLIQPQRQLRNCNRRARARPLCARLQFRLRDYSQHPAVSRSGIARCFSLGCIWRNAPLLHQGSAYTRCQGYFQSQHRNRHCRAYSSKY